LDKQYTLTPLFAIPLYESRINTVDDQTLELIKNLEYHRMVSGSGDSSNNDYILDLPEFAHVKQNIMDEFNYFIKNILMVKDSNEFYMTNSWVVKHHPGDWGGLHFHTNCLMSGVYYIDVTDSTGKICFQKETNYQNLFPPVIDVEFDSFNSINCKRWTCVPENGKIVLFPSTLSHFIEKNNSTSVRYSIAFNFFVRGTLGVYSSILDLK
jgi:uncharacterized protein (TIGR02466 family)